MAASTPHPSVVVWHVGLALSLAATSGVARSQAKPIFESARSIALAALPSESVGADLDGDGDEDLVAVLSSTRRIAVLRNRGDGDFEAPQYHEAAIFPHHLACDDLDGDGDLDLVLLDEDASALHVYPNLGDGSFAASVGFAAGHHPSAASVADFDGDGRSDVALVTSVAYGAPSGLWIAWNDGHGRLSTTSVMPGPFGTTAVSSADLDGDGDVDLVLIAAAQIVVLANRGDRTFEVRPAVDVGGNVRRLRLDDHDDDGDVDALLERDQYPGQTTTLLSARNVGGIFETPLVVATIRITAAVEVADWDGDRRTDVLIHDPFLDELQLFRGRGDGTLEAPREYALEVELAALAAVDIDGDGDPDAVGAAENATRALVLVANRGAGRFDAEEHASQGNAVSVEAADLDGDGDLDLLGRSGSMWIHENLSGGVFSTFAYVPDSNHDGARLADFDGDGDVDIARVRAFAHLVAVSSNAGDGTFTASVAMTLAGYPERIACGDVDGDGDVDLAVALQNPWWSETPYGLLVLQNRGDGQFDRGDSFDVDGSATLIELLDVDGDGDLDLALGTQSTDPWFVRNDGLGHFDASHPQTLPMFEAFADLDGDGRIDVLANEAPDSLVWSRNRGDGVFDPARVIFSGEPVAGANLIAFDVEGDGDLDLTTGLLVLENDGSETFTVAERLHGSSPTRPCAADVDGDGDDDLVLPRRVRVIRNGSRNGVAFGLGDGSGTPCPCGNTGAIGRGCASSFDPSGALLHATGNARLSNDTAVLHASGAAPGTKTWIQGTLRAGGGLGAPFGDGLIGVAGSLIRLATVAAGSSEVSYPTGFAEPLHVAGGVVAPGTRTYQMLYRDSGSFCTPAAFNLTNALVVTWIP